MLKPKYNQYTIFNNWLFDGNIQSDFPPETVMNVVTPKMLMERLCSVGNVTIFLNEYFNNPYIFQIDKKSFFIMIKELVIKKKITFKHFSWYKNNKSDDIISKIRKRFPHLKRQDIETLLIKLDGTEEYNKIMDMIGENKVKKVKLTKKTKNEINKKVKEKENNVDKKISFNNWVSSNIGSK